MTWFAVDDSFHGHPKLAELEAGGRFAEALSLWTVAGSWCASHLTDGRVPAAQLRKLVPFSPSRAADELARVGMWDRVDGGFQFHDWDHYQPLRNEVEERRQKSAARTRKSRQQAQSRVTSSVTNVERDVLETLSRPVPSRPVPEESATHSPGARDPGLGLMPQKPVTDEPSKRAVIEVLKVFESAWGSPLGLLPDPNHTRVKALLKGASERNPGNPLEAIGEAARAACANENFRRTGSPFAAFCAQPWRHMSPEGSPNVAPAKVLTPERQALAAAVAAVESARGTDREHEAVERHREAKRAVAMSERPAS